MRRRTIVPASSQYEDIVANLKPGEPRTKLGWVIQHWEELVPYRAKPIPQFTGITYPERRATLGIRESR